jgi:rhodanese-related sulfurtransferase
MVGTVGRTDLFGDERAAQLAREQYQSLQRLLTLPDDLRVYPTHGAGSFCSTPGTSERTTTIGRERATNPLLQIGDEDEFVERLLTSFGTLPPYFRRLPEINRVGAPITTGMSLPRLPVEHFERLVDAGATVVDVRPIDKFADGHLPGSISNALRPVFGGWLAWLTVDDAAVVFVADEDQDVDDLLRQGLTVGCDNLAGVLDGGMHAWLAAGGSRRETELLTPAPDATGPVVDVRQREEFLTSHVPGARNVELGDTGTAILPHEPMTLMCGHGERAMTAASILQRRGRHDVRVLLGGPDDWSAATGISLQYGA